MSSLYEQLGITQEDLIDKKVMTAMHDKELGEEVKKMDEDMRSHIPITISKTPITLPGEISKTIVKHLRR